MTATSESVSAATLVTADNFVRAETDMYFSREVWFPMVTSDEVSRLGTALAP